MFHSSGSLRYSETDGNYKINIEVDPDIVNLYRYFIPKSIDLNRTKFTPHITVVRNEAPNLKNWGMFEGEEVAFSYKPLIGRGNIYWWLPAYAPRLIEIRQGLDLLKSSKWTRPPNDEECFHITIGNLKEKS